MSIFGTIDNKIMVLLKYQGMIKIYNSVSEPTTI